MSSINECSKPSSNNRNINRNRHSSISIHTGLCRMMTKKDIQRILKERFNVEVTLRPRKATLQRILKSEVDKSTKAHCSGWHRPKMNYWKIIPITFFVLTLVVLLPL